MNRAYGHTRHAGFGWLFICLGVLSWGMSGLGQAAGLRESGQAMAGISPDSLNNPVRALLHPVRQTTLASPMEGRLLEIRADVGEPFKAADTLVQFDCTILKANLYKGQVALSTATRIHTANRKLHAFKALGDLDMVRSEAEVALAKASLKVLQAQAQQCVLAAPFSGRVVKRLAQPFQYVAEGEGLVEIVDDANLELRLLVPSVWTAWLRPGRPFRVRMDENGHTYAARVSVLGARVDPVSQTLEIRAALDNPTPDLLPGMSGSAWFTPFPSH